MLKRQTKVYLSFNRRPSLTNTFTSSSTNSQNEWDKECSQFLCKSLEMIGQLQNRVSKESQQQQQQIAQHRQSIILFLQERLQRLSLKQKTMQSLRLEQEQMTNILLPNNSLLEAELESKRLHQPKEELSHDERMVLEQENDQLLEELLGLEKEVGQVLLYYYSALLIIYDYYT